MGRRSGWTEGLAAGGNKSVMNWSELDGPMERRVKENNGFQLTKKMATAQQRQPKRRQQQQK